MANGWNDKFDVIVIGSGFGGAVAITKLVEKGLPDIPKPRVLVLERGTWWRNPEGPGLRSFNDKPSPPIEGNWQYWARPNDSQGLVYIANSIYKEHNPVWDAVNPFFKDNDLGVMKNRKGMYRLTRFDSAHGKVDVVSGSAVGGGSLFYSGVNLIPHDPVLKRIGLGHLSSADFVEAGKWMKQFRGHINKINTKLPVPHYKPCKTDVDAKPEKYFQLGAIPESGDPVANVSEYEMPAPELCGKPDADYVLLDRARVLKRSMERVVANGGFEHGSQKGSVEHGPFEALPLSVVEYDVADDDDSPGDAKKQSDSTKKNTYCLREGRCVLGCLPSARHTLYKTIQNQRQDGKDISVLPLTKVSHIDKVGDDYVVRFQSELEGSAGQRTQAQAPMVFLAGGCLGTSEVMLRTRQKHDLSGGAEGLPVSDMVGRKFSTNGDFFAFTYDLPRDYKTRKHVEDDKRIGNANSTVGPINSSHFYVTFGDDKTTRTDINVEDAGIPTTFARLVHGLLPHASDWDKFMTLAKSLIKVLLNKDPFASPAAPDTEAREQTEYLTERELMADIFFYNLMGSGPNEPEGRFSLQPDGVGLDLTYDQAAPLAEWDVFKKQEAILDQLTKAMDDPGEDPGRKPQLMPSPFWQNDKRVTVVHPLGGCVIGSDSSNGVCNEFGEVFDGSQPSGSTDVLEKLYIVDASAIPGALGVNPTYTIVTHAVRCLDHVLPET